MNLFRNPAALVILLILVILLFGAGKLPGLAKNLGQSMRIFKSEVEEMTHNRDEDDEDDDPRDRRHDDRRDRRYEDEDRRDRRYDDDRRDRRYDDDRRERDYDPRDDRERETVRHREDDDLYRRD